MGDIVVVTGGHGFVAGWCIIDLLERGSTVRATVRDLAPRIKDSRGGRRCRPRRRSSDVRPGRSDERRWAGRRDGRKLTPDLGRRNTLTSDKARRVLSFTPRPAADTVVDCARSLLINR